MFTGAVFECARDARLDGFEAEGFEDVVERAEARESLGVSAGVDAGDDDDGRVGLALPQLAEEFGTAPGGHRDVGQPNVVEVLAYEGEGLLRAGCRVARVV